MSDSKVDQTRTTTNTPDVLEFSRTTTTEDRLRETGQLLNRIRLVQDDANHLADNLAPTHSAAFDDALERRTSAAANRTVQDLLGDLADRGFAWRDVARLVGVSVPALRKWRQGENTTGENRRLMAQLVAFVEMLEDEGHVRGVAAWLEMPLSHDAPLNGLDVYAGGRLELLHERACLRLSDDEVLNAFEPGWRERFRSDFEVFTAPDGERGIRPKRSGD